MNARLSTLNELTLSAADELIACALKTARDKGWLISAAVSDRHGNLIAFAREDGSTLASVLSSQAKAWTAAATGTSTADLQAVSAPGEAVYGLPYAAGPGRSMTPVPGAVPIYGRDGVILGAIGVGGAPTPGNDHMIAETATAL